jgi:cobalt-zinc-cadmium efflux system outer membrane protein
MRLKTTIARWIAGASVLLNTSCVPFRARSLDPSRRQADFESRTLSSPELKAYLADHRAERGPWNVNRLALVAVYFHPDIALARAEAEEAAAAIVTARMRPNPVLSFSPQYASYRAPVFTPWFLGGSFSLPLETAGKRSKRMEQAHAKAEAARWRMIARSWDARSRVRSAMLELYGTKENIRLLESEQSLHEEVIKKLTSQMEAGAVSPFELTQARLLLNRTRLTLADTRRIADTAQAKLAAAIGVPLHALPGVELDFSSFKRLPLPSDSVARALTSRADLLALLAEYAAAEAALKIELARQYPDIQFSPGYDYNSGQNRWQLGFNITLPLNRNRGPIAEADARRTTAEKRFLATQHAIRAEVDLAVAAYQAARSKVQTAQQLASEASAAAQTTRKMVEAGDVSALDLTRRRIETSAAKVALMAAEIEAQTAVGALEDAMQSPLH